jgi:hypothetical protein
MLDELRIIVDYAYDNVPLYRKLYQKKPELKSLYDFKNLPYVRISDFMACNIEDVISDVDDVAVVLPPIENKTIFPFPRLESTSDRDRRYEIFYYLIEQTGIKEGSSFVVLTDSSHSYFCGEIVNNLLFYKYPTSMIFIRDHSADEIEGWVKKLSPDCLLIGVDSMIGHNWEVPHIFTINQYDRLLNPPNPLFQRGNGMLSFQRGNKPLIPFEKKRFDIYAISEIGWIAIKTPDGNYIYPEDYFYIETDSADDILVLTTLANDLQPFIRYKTSDRAKILDGNCFQITYIGEH